MKKRFRILILCTALLLCLCMVACDLQSGGLLGALLDRGSQELEDLPQDIVGTLPGVGAGDIFDIETTTDVEVETDLDYWASPELGAFDALNGEVFVILSNSETNVSFDEPDRSDPVEMNMYDRDNMIQGTYGVRLDCLVAPDYIELSDMVKRDVLAGEGEYDLVYQHMVHSATYLAMSGCLHNLANVDYLDPEQVWWDQGCNNGFMIGDQIMMMSGDLLPATTQLTSAVFFNQRLFDEYGLEYPYQDVRDGTWTLDDMLKLTKDQTMDLNGDGKLDEYDMYGLSGWSLDCDYAYQFGAGGTMFTYDQNHLPIYSANHEQLVDMYDKIYTLIVTNASFHVTVSEYVQNNALYSEPLDIFMNGRSLFFTGTLTAARQMVIGDMHETYGILPAPKFDERQENYQSFVNGSASVAVLPLGLSDQQLTRSGFMMELLASSTYYMVNDSLHRSFVQNDDQIESLQMLDVIISNKIADFGYVYFHAVALPCASLVQMSLNNDRQSVGSDISKAEKKTQKELAKVYEAYGYDYDN